MRLQVMECGVQVLFDCEAPGNVSIRDAQSGQLDCSFACLLASLLHCLRLSFFLSDHCLQPMLCFTASNLCCASVGAACVVPLHQHLCLLASLPPPQLLSLQLLPSAGAACVVFQWVQLVLCLGAATDLIAGESMPFEALTATTHASVVRNPYPVRVVQVTMSCDVADYN